MLLAIVQGTPHWVWALLGALLWLGASQMLPRRTSLRHALLSPLAITVFSAWGLISAFDRTHAATALGTWAGTSLVVARVSLAVHRGAPAGTRFDPRALRFHLPGSTAPLLLILAIFFTKYIVGVELALRPELAGNGSFALDVALIYGLFNGLLLARVARLWRIARPRSVATA